MENPGANTVPRGVTQSSTRAMSTSLARVWPAAGIILAFGTATILYRGAIIGFFAQDDFGWLCDSRFHSAGEFFRCFTRFNPAQSYRPLSQETFFWFGQKVFGMWPPGFHILSLAVHLLGGLCLYYLLRRFFSPFPCIIGTLFYTAHNAHFSSVYWISAMPEPMAAVFFLSSLLLFVTFDTRGKPWMWALSIACMILGIMSKESILTLPLVLAAYCLIFSCRRLVWTIPHLSLTALYVIVRSLSPAVKAAPYPLAFGWQAWKNLESYLSWTAGFSEVFLRFKLKWSPELNYPWLAALTVLIFACLFLAAKSKRGALFAIVWFAASLQPVLYFSGHIYPYYLAPSLAAASLLIAAAVPPLSNRKGWIPAMPLIAFCLWSSEASLKREGRWWVERSFVARDILNAMSTIDRQVLPGHTAYLFGLSADEFGVMQNDAALKAYGFESPRFILVGLDTETASQIQRLRTSGGIGSHYCFVYSGRRFFNWTDGFRRGDDFVGRSPVRLELNAHTVRAGADFLRLHLENLNARAIDVLYTRDGELQPVVREWQLDEHHETTIFLDSRTPKGTYHYCAVRDSAAGSPRPWYLVYQTAIVK